MTEDYKFDSKVVQQFSNEYQNHGMLKWKVFYLSDQTSKLNKSARQQYETEHRQHSKEMTRKAINHIIKNALLKNLTCLLKLN